MAEASIWATWYAWHTDSPGVGRPQDYRPIHPLPESREGPVYYCTGVAYNWGLQKDETERTALHCLVGFSMDKLFHFARKCLETI